MCGRFTLRTPADILVQQFQLDAAPSLLPRYNIAPTQSVAAIRPAEDGSPRRLAMLRWGLIPPWAADPSIGSSLINARAETVDEKPAFRSAFKKGRCLIIADGFYEWKKTGKHKQPYYLQLKDVRPFAFAGLAELWKREDQIIESCTIITTEPNRLTAEVHDRMPVILPADLYDLWLDSEFQGTDKLVSMLSPYPADEMVATPVSTLVNNSRHDDPQCVAPEELGPSA